MRHSFIIIDDETESVLKTLTVATRFQNLHFVGSANSYEEGVNLILEHQPSLVFLEINPINRDSNLSLQLINELYRYLDVVPKIIVTSSDKNLAYDAIKHGAFDYLAKPVDANDVRKFVMLYEKSIAKPVAVSTKDILRQITENHIVYAPIAPSAIAPDEAPMVVEKPEAIEETELEVQSEPVSSVITEEENPTYDSQETIEAVKALPFQADSNKEEKPLIICVKSYGDYRFIEAKDICYLQADNNSTDIHLYNGEMITAFKTLKHFENVLSFPFIRIHNSYIVNIDYVSRIHTGNSVCYIKNTTTKLPFSKSYKENVDAIINSITKGNYLEI
jgi:DNA-binding LytR/AlgR family response regulator